MHGDNCVPGPEFDSRCNVHHVDKSFNTAFQILTQIKDWPTYKVSVLFIGQMCNDHLVNHFFNSFIHLLLHLACERQTISDISKEAKKQKNKTKTK